MAFAQNLEISGCSDSQMQDWFKEKLKITQQPFKSYHWGSRVGASLTSQQQIRTRTFPAWEEKLQTNDWDGKYPLNSQTQWSKNYFRKMSSNFYYDDLPKNDPRLSKIMMWDVGMGLYTALDPIQSISYARDNWILLEVTVPQGVTYLDYQKHTDSSYGPCGKNLGYDFNLVGGKEDREFRNLFWNFILKYQVQFIHYQWRESTPVELCEEGSHVGAFNFINPKIMDVPGFGLKLFTKHKGLKNPNSRADYLEMARKLHSLNQISLKKYDHLLTNFGWNSILKKYDKGPQDQSEEKLLEQYRSEFFQCNYQNPSTALP